MFDLTKNVQLTKKEKRVYYILQFMLLVFVIFGAILFTKELIFPTQSFQFNSKIDSLANTISRPYETSRGTALDISTIGDFDVAKITITLPPEMPRLPDNTPILIKHSYLSFLSPINTKQYKKHFVTTYQTIDNEYYIEKDVFLYPFISKNAFDSYHFKHNISDVNLQNLPIPVTTEYEGFAPATLISSKDGIYVIDGNKKHPIQDERTFKALGYNYDNVIKTNSQERSLHKKAKLFTIKSSHPFGTIFWAKDTDHTFVYDNNILNHIDTTATSKQYAIQVQEASRNTVATCILQKTLFPRQYSCSTSLKDITNFNGNAYQFILQDAPNTNIQEVSIKLFTATTKNSLINRIESLKRKFNTNYQ